jgi:hypothetical protein
MRDQMKQVVVRRLPRLRSPLFELLPKLHFDQVVSANGDLRNLVEDTFVVELVSVSKLLSRLEAAIGIEPMNKGFAEIYQHGSRTTMEV